MNSYNEESYKQEILKALIFIYELETSVHGSWCELHGCISHLWLSEISEQPV